MTSPEGRRSAFGRGRSSGGLATDPDAPRHPAVAVVRQWSERALGAPSGGPDAPAPPRAGERTGPAWTRVLLAVGAVVAGAALSLLRQTGAPATGTIWAEDGQIFYHDAVFGGLLATLFEPYNGYLLVLPRLLAAPLAWLPVDAGAAVLALEAATVNALVALLVYVASGSVLRSVPLRLVVAVVAVLPSVGQAEVLNNISNLHWAGLYAVFWIALWTPATRVGRVVGAVTVGLFAFTNILIVLFVPLLAVRALLRRDRGAVALAAAGVAGVAGNLINLVFGAGGREGVALDFQTSFLTFFTRVLPASALGENIYGPVGYPTAGRALKVLALLVVLAFAAAALLRRRTANWPVALLAFAHSLVFWVVAFGITGQMASRYSATSWMLLTAGVAALLVPGDRPVPGDGPDPVPGATRVAVPGQVTAATAADSSRSAMGGPGAEPWWRPTLRTAPGFVLAGLMLVQLAANFFTTAGNQRGLGPTWADSVRAGRAECAETNQRGDTGDGTVRLDITPQRWGVRLPCSFLD